MTFAAVMARPAEAPVRDVYAKLAVASAVFFVTFEILYFVLSWPVAWSTPVGDAFGHAVGRDYLNTWMGARSAFGKGPAVWFDFALYYYDLLDVLPPYDNFPLHYWSYPP